MMIDETSSCHKHVNMYFENHKIKRNVQIGVYLSFNKLSWIAKK